MPRCGALWAGRSSEARRDFFSGACEKHRTGFRLWGSGIFWVFGARGLYEDL